MITKAALGLPLAGVIVAMTIACSSSPDPPVVSTSGNYIPYGTKRVDATGIVAPVPGSWDPITNQPYAAAGQQTVSLNQPPLIRPQYPAVPSRSIEPRPVVIPQVSRRGASSLLREVRVEKDYLPYRARGRTRRSMRPRYITIHSTQNWSRGADARRHSLALKRSKLGRLSWHYTTDEDRAVQHLPTNEQGNHADYNGPGNKYSIGIEMCENKGNSRSATVERTAKLAAWLMYKHNIPISRVVPHYKWPRWGKRPPNKNCPHFLMTNGRPGAKWAGFVNKVRKYHRQIVR